MMWAAQEFDDLDLGDKRLNTRLVKLAEAFAREPTATIPGACGGWAETQGAYRFFSKELDWQDILSPYWQCTRTRTRTRMSEHPVVLCLQDTTELDFNGQVISGLGRLSYEAQRGMYLHPTYVVTPDRDVLSCTYGVSHSSTPRTANPDGDDDSGKPYVVKASGNPRFQALTFTDCTGNGAQSLRRYCDEKVPISKVEFRACKPAGGALQAYLALTLGDCRIITVTPLGDPDDPQALEHISLRYGTIQVDARETKEDGTLGESTIAGWDIGRNAELP